MKNSIRYGFILGVICAAAAALLSGVNFLTNPRIVAQASSEQENSLKEIMPEGANFEPISSNGKVIYYKTLDKQGVFIGVVFIASAQGYSSDIQTMVGMQKNGMISAVKVISQNETPGLGSRVAENEFKDQFKNQGLNDIDKVQAITGATISSKAMIDSVKLRGQEILKLISNE